MVRKQQRSIGLSDELIRFIEEHRGNFSFSAYVEYLCREGIRSLNIEQGKVGEPIARRAVIRAR
jgi:hypothetical protein